jgi:F-type H+-transporting ATPase subunit gamma
MALREVKNKIRATLRTNKVTKAMEAVSAVKMRRSQEYAFSGRPYATAVLRVLARVSGSLEGSQHPLASARPIRRALFILVTSDKGLAGALNSSILKEAEKAIEGTGLPKESIMITAIGRKGHDHFRKRGYDTKKSFINVADDVPEGLMDEIIGDTAFLYRNGEVDVVYLMYTNFRSTFAQEPVVRKIFPLSAPAVEEIVRGIVPEKGKFSDIDAGEEARIPTYAVEPGEQAVLDVLLPKLAAVALYHGFLEAKASEHSARMVAMKNASDKSKEMAQDLSRKYNKARQAVITREVSEIVGGIEAMSS